MIKLIETLATLNNEQVNEFYKSLKAQGFTSAELEAIQTQVFTYKLFNDKAFYNAVEETVREQYLKEIA